MIPAMFNAAYTLVLVFGGLLIMWAAYPLAKNTAVALWERWRSRGKVLKFPKDDEHA